MSVTVKSDSKAALGAADKLRSPSVAMNEVVREMSLDLAEGRYKIDLLKHLLGKLNVWADALSRFHEPGKGKEIPEEFVGLARAKVARRSSEWWITAGDPMQ